MGDPELIKLIKQYIEDKNLTVYDIADITGKVLGEMSTTTKELHGAISIVNKNTKKHADIEQDHLPRFSHNMLYDTLVSILSREKTKEAVFDHIKEVYDKDDAWIKAAKHEKVSDVVVSGVTNRLYQSNKNIINTIDEEGIQVKDVIHSRTTPSGQVNVLSTLMAMVDAINELRQTTNLLVIKDVINTSRLDSIEDYLSNGNIKIEANKLAAIKLKSEGYTFKEIANVLGVTDRTIKNWIRLNK